MVGHVVLGSFSNLHTYTMATEMQAIRFHKTGDLDVVQQDTLPIPNPEPKQVVIRTELAGVNYIDIYFRSGLYPSPLPRTLGQEVGGKIVEVGSEVEGLAVGDTVVALASNAMAERVAVDQTLVAKVPEGVELRAATALFLQGLTAVVLTHTSYAVQPGDWALVHAAAGGTGLLLVQMIKAMGGHVIGTTSTEAKAKTVKANGADHVLLYGEHATPEENAKKVLELTSGRGVQVVYDSVGKSTWDANFDAVARLGTLISFGQSSGTPEPLALARLSPKNLKVLRPALFNYIETKEEMHKYASLLFGFLEQGKVRASVWREYLFGAAGVQEAQRELSSRATSGKLLIRAPLHAGRA